MTERQAVYRIGNVAQLGSWRLQEFEARWHVQKEVTHFDARTNGAPGNLW